MQDFGLISKLNQDIFICYFIVRVKIKIISKNKDLHFDSEAWKKIFFYQKYILIYDERKIGTLTVKGTVCGILSDPPGGPGVGGW